MSINCPLDFPQIFWDNGYMKLILGLLVYGLSIATIIAFMMGATRKEKEWDQNHGK